MKSVRNSRTTRRKTQVDKDNIISEEDLSILKSTAFFKNINEAKFRYLCKNLNLEKKIYNADEIIFNEDDTISCVYFLLDGEIRINRYDIYGRKHIISSGHKGDIFGEAFAFSTEKKSTVSVECVEKSTVIAMPYESIVACEDSVFFSEIVKVVADKNIFLQQKLQILSKQKMRDKILLFIQIFRQNNSVYIDVPFNREEMSEFLCVDRSALSRELAKLKSEGIIDYNKSTFRILK